MNDNVFLQCWIYRTFSYRVKNVMLYLLGCWLMSTLQLKEHQYNLFYVKKSWSLKKRTVSVYKECDCGDTVFRERFIKWSLIQTRKSQDLSPSLVYLILVACCLALKGTSQMGDSCGRNHDLYQKDNVIVSKCESSQQPERQKTALLIFFRA